MGESGLILLVEDDDDLRQATVETLETAGFGVEAHDRAAPALDRLTPDWPGVVLTDLRMPGLSGLGFLDSGREKAPDVPFVVITGHGDVASAIHAMRSGAHDFLEKPCPPELLIDVLRRAMAMRQLALENATLRDRLSRAVALEDQLIGRSAVMADLRRRVAGLAALRVDLLVAGETGTGKELVARILHGLSPRKDGPFVAVNCGALHEADVDRELFGDSAHPGRIARADGGTLYLDALECMPDPLQVRLLRVLETREIAPLGEAARQLDLRILGSVKRDPAQLVAEGLLRADLYHRFNAGALRLPPLRDRPGDAEGLLDHFLREAALRHDLPRPAVPSDLRRQLDWYRWPGNVREVRTVAERLVIGLEVSLTDAAASPVPLSQDYDSAMAAFESRLLQAALMQTGGRKAEAAHLLRIPRKRLYLRLREHGLG